MVRWIRMKLGRYLIDIFPVGNTISGYLKEIPALWSIVKQEELCIWNFWDDLFLNIIHCHTISMIVLLRNRFSEVLQSLFFTVWITWQQPRKGSIPETDMASDILGINVGHKASIISVFSPAKVLRTWQAFRKARKETQMRCIIVKAEQIDRTVVFLNRMWAYNWWEPTLSKNVLKG